MTTSTLARPLTDHALARPLDPVPPPARDRAPARLRLRWSLWICGLISFALLLVVPAVMIATGAPFSTVTVWMSVGAIAITALLNFASLCLDGLLIVVALVFGNR